MTFQESLVRYLVEMPERFQISLQEAEVFIEDPTLCLTLEDLVGSGVEPHKAAVWMLNHPQQRRLPLEALLTEINRKPFADTPTAVVERACRAAITADPEVVQKYRAGKHQVLGKLIAAVRKTVPANPTEIKTSLETLLRTN